MEKKLNKAQRCAIGLLVISVLLRVSSETVVLTEDQNKELELILADLAKQKDRIVGIINNRPFPDLDVIFSGDDVDIEAALAKIDSSMDEIRALV